MTPDDPFYRPRPSRSLPQAMAVAPSLGSGGSGGRIDRRAALLLNPFYAKSPYGSFGKHVLTPSLSLTSIAGATPPGWRVRVPGTRTCCKGRRRPTPCRRWSASPCT